MNKKIFLMPIVFSSLLLSSCHDFMKRVFWGGEPTYTDEQKEKYPQCDFDATVSDFRKSLDMSKNAYKTTQTINLNQENSWAEVDDKELNFAYFICDNLLDSEALGEQDDSDFVEAPVWYKWKHQLELSGIYTTYDLSFKLPEKYFIIEYSFSYDYSEYIYRRREKYYSLSDEQISSISKYVSKYKTDDDVEWHERSTSEESA